MTKTERDAKAARKRADEAEAAALAARDEARAAAAFAVSLEQEVALEHWQETQRELGFKPYQDEHGLWKVRQVEA